MPVTFRVCGNSLGRADQIESRGEPECIQRGLFSSHPRVFNSNGFVNTVCYSYNKHLRLVIRPDDIWGTILVRLRSLYKNANQVRIGFAPIDEKFITGNSWLIPKFSTTTFNDRLLASVFHCATPVDFSSEEFELQCGIPEVTLLGKKEDWEKLKTNISSLKVPLKWLQAVSPILQEFVDVFSNPPKLMLWTRICSYVGGGSSVRYLSGWITLFCTFQTNQEPIQSESVPGTFFSSPWPFVATKRIPMGYYNVYFSDSPHVLQVGHRSILNTDESEIQPGVEWSLLENLLEIH